MKTKTIIDKIEKMLNTNKAYFITMTFNNNSLKLKPKTREIYIKKYLKQNTKEYVLNLDYGSKTKREHYHAIIIFKNKLLNIKPYLKYGLIQIFKINKYNRYLKNKKTNHEIAIDLYKHATKETTNQKIITNR